MTFHLPPSLYKALFLSFLFISHPISSFCSPPPPFFSFLGFSMVKTREGSAFWRRVCRSSPPLAGRPPPYPKLLLPPPLWLPLLQLRAVLSWFPPLQPVPRGDTTLGLALLHPLHHILGHLEGPYCLRGPEPLAQESPPALGLRSHSHHLIRVILEHLLWTCPQIPSSGGHSSTTTLSQGMLIAVRGTCMMRFITIFHHFSQTRSFETRCS